MNLKKYFLNGFLICSLTFALTGCNDLFRDAPVDKMSEKDVYGSLLKCGNQLCSERIGRMRSYLSSLQPNLVGFDLNKYLVIDRFKWENTNIDLSLLFSFVENNNEQGFFEYLAGYLTTQLQLRNLNLVWKAGFIVLREYYEKFIRV